MYLSKAIIAKYCELCPPNGASQKIWITKPDFSAIIKFNDNEYANNYCDVFYSTISKKINFDCVDSNFCKLELTYDEIEYMLNSKEEEYLSLFPTYKSHLKKTIYKYHLLSDEGSISKNFNSNNDGVLYLDDIIHIVTKKNFFAIGTSDQNLIGVNNVNFAMNNIKNYCADNYLDFNKRGIFIELCKRSIFDWFMFQGDRADWNIAFLIDEKNSTLKLAPSFDNSYCYPFCYEYDEVNLKDKALSNKFKYKTRRIKLQKKKTRFNVRPKNWYNYEYYNDFETLKNIAKLYNQFPEIKDFVKKIILLDTKKELNFLNDNARQNDCMEIPKSKLKVIYNALQYKQDLIKSLVKNDTLDNVSNTNCKDLFEFLKEPLEK